MQYLKRDDIDAFIENSDVIIKRNRMKLLFKTFQTPLKILHKKAIAYKVF